MSKQIADIVQELTYDVFEEAFPDNNSNLRIKYVDGNINVKIWNMISEIHDTIEHHNNPKFN